MLLRLPPDVARHILLMLDPEEVLAVSGCSKEHSALADGVWDAFIQRVLAAHPWLVPPPAAPARRRPTSGSDARLLIRQCEGDPRAVRRAAELRTSGRHAEVRAPQPRAVERRRERDRRALDPGPVVGRVHRERRGAGGAGEPHARAPVDGEVAAVRVVAHARVAARGALEQCRRVRGAPAARDEREIAVRRRGLVVADRVRDDGDARASAIRAGCELV